MREPRVVVHARELTLDDWDTVEPEVSFPFGARVDHVLKSALLKLTVTPLHSRSPVRGLEVRVNDETVVVVGVEELSKRRREPLVIPIASQFMNDRNLLQLRLLVDREGPCGEVDRGAWRVLRSIQLVTESLPLPLPNNLALLPLPFVDRDFDDEADIPIVFGGAPTLETVHLAAILASWFGSSVGQPLRFPATVGVLPESSAVVLIDSHEDAEALGLPMVEGPAALMLDHPGVSNAPAKLLVLAGRTREELGIAVRALASGTVTLAGESVALSEPPAPDQSRPYDAPRWLPPGRNVAFERYPLVTAPGGAGLRHEGLRDGTISVSFRLAPDLWTWPTEFVDLDLGYTQELPPNVAPPRLDLELNGNFIATLPPLDPAKNETVGRAALRVRAEQLYGYNRFQLHVRYPRTELACAQDQVTDARIGLTSDSTLNLSAFGHFSSLTDVSLFVHDGFPFTRVADLGDTALVLPEDPKLSEVSTALSFIARFASVTGAVASRLTVLSPEQLFARPGLDKDLFVVGVSDDNAFLRRFSDRLPAVVGPAGAQIQAPRLGNLILDTWSSLQTYLDRGRADDVFFRARRLGVAMSIRSPWRDDRAAVIVTATSPGLLPAASELTGHAESLSRWGDLLVSAGSQLWMFQVGPVHDRGKLDFWTALRRFFALRWVLLLPGFLLGSLILAVDMRASLGRLAARRLDPEDRRT